VVITNVNPFINAGASWFVGGTLYRWYAGPVTGAVLDLLSLAIVSGAAWILMRRRGLTRPTPYADVSASR
jgi:hypothetical protein